jgi:hypothetical protein
MRRFALAAVLVAIGTVASVARGEAAGSPTWTLQTTPTPNVPAEGGELVGVSCPSSTDCVAVGFDVALPLSETWNGAKWMVRPVSVPAGALGHPCRTLDQRTLGDSTHTTNHWRDERYRDPLGGRLRQGGRLHRGGYGRICQLGSKRHPCGTVEWEQLGGCAIAHSARIRLERAQQRFVLLSHLMHRSRLLPALVGQPVLPGGGMEWC